MIIALAVNEKRETESYSSASGFLWFDTGSEEADYAENAGNSRENAKLLGDIGAEELIVKEIGCADVNRLRGFQITVYKSETGIVKDDLSLFKAGKLSIIRTGDCDSGCK